MSNCLDSCSSTCISAGVTKFLSYIKTILQLTIGDIDALFLENAFNTFKCTLPPNIRDRITLLIRQITSLTSTLVKDILIFSVLVIFLTMLLLIIFVYLTIYIFTPAAMIGFFIASLIIIIIAIILLYFGILSLYDSGSTKINDNLIEIENLLLSIECAANNGFCCLASETGTPGCSLCVFC